MLQKLQEHIHKNLPFLKDAKLLIAISGGLDSVVLTHLFNDLNYNISLAHCNFQLRDKESDMDAEFVHILSQKTSNQIFKIEFDTQEYSNKNKISTQIAARELRYNWFQKLVKQYSFDYILTAHHADDNLETFLINLTRGSGLSGFTGIPEINGNIIRPLLPFSRSEILEYAKENKIDWREDVSNASTKYVRNKIRHQVVPVLKEINPSLLTSFSSTIKNLKESEQIIKDRIKEVASEAVTTDFSTTLEVTKIDIQKINKLSNPKAYLYQLLKTYNFTAWNDVYDLLSAQSGKQVFSKTHQLLKDRDFLFLSKYVISSVVEKSLIEQNQSEITIPIHITLEDVEEKSTQNKSIIHVDKNLLKYPLIVRKWQNGDYLYPTGMLGKKKLSKFFKDEKFSLLDKENTWLLCNADEQIVWVINHRQDRRFVGNQKLKITLHS